MRDVFEFHIHYMLTWRYCDVGSPTESRQKSGRKSRGVASQQQGDSSKESREKDKRERERAREIERELEREREKAREKEISSFREFSVKLPIRRRNKHSSFGPDDPVPDPAQYSLTPLHYESHAMAAASEQQVRQSLRQMPPIAHQHVSTQAAPSSMHVPRDNRSREGQRLRNPRPAPLGGPEPHPPYNMPAHGDLPPSRGGSKGPPSLTPRAQALIGIDPLAASHANGGLYGGGNHSQPPHQGMKYVNSSGVMGGMMMVPDDGKQGHKALPHISHPNPSGGGYHASYLDHGGFPNEESKMGNHSHIYQQHGHDTLSSLGPSGASHFNSSIGQSGSHSGEGGFGGGGGSGKQKYPAAIGKM